eukprot:5491-Heterococcus_DN1.PRE.4
MAWLRYDENTIIVLPHMIAHTLIVGHHEDRTTIVRLLDLSAGACYCAVYIAAAVAFQQYDLDRSCMPDQSQGYHTSICTTEVLSASVACCSRELHMSDMSKIFGEVPDTAEVDDDDIVEDVSAGTTAKSSIKKGAKASKSSSKKSSTAIDADADVEDGDVTDDDVDNMDDDDDDDDTGFFKDGADTVDTDMDIERSAQVIQESRIAAEHYYRQYDHGLYSLCVKCMCSVAAELHTEQHVNTAQILKLHPDIGIVMVDDMGNILENSPVNPYEDPEDPLELGDINTQGEDDEWPEIAGEIAGMDDPVDAPWRRSAEAIIREQVAINGLHCYDIMWSFHKLEVTVTRGDVPEDSDEAGYVDSEELMSTIRAVNDALEDVEDELRVLGRHELIIATPGAKNILTTDREFQAFTGFDVEVMTGSTFNIQRLVTGKLLERTFDELIITQKGRKVRIPLALVDEVRLPEAKVEPGEQWNLPSDMTQDELDDEEYEEE